MVGPALGAVPEVRLVVLVGLVGLVNGRAHDLGDVGRRGRGRREWRGAARAKPEPLSVEQAAWHLWACVTFVRCFPRAHTEAHLLGVALEQLLTCKPLCLTTL